jgi:hypothetical protein
MIISVLPRPEGSDARVQPKLTTGGQALCTPDNPTTGAAEETSIRQLLAHGKSKTALDRAKDLHKALGSAASESLLIDAYAGRIQALLDQNLALEAKSLIDLVRSRYPSAKTRLDALKATSAARAGALDELLVPLADPGLGAEHRAAIEQAVQNKVADLAAIAACPALPADHSLRIAAAALDRAFVAATSGLVTDEEIALPEVSHRSPLGSWKLLVRAMAHFYRGEDDLCRECLGAIKPESVPARLIPAMHSMLGMKPAAPLTAAEAALVSRATESSAALRNELEKLDRAFADDEDESRTFKLVRLAMQECRRTLPDQVETLKRLIYVRGSMDAVDGERLTAALQGMPRQDAAFFRALAHGMEATGADEDLAMACEYWDEFRQRAVREGWFGAKGMEVATLYSHMAGLLRRIPEDDLQDLQRESRSNRKLGIEDSYFLFPEKLYERACVLDPHPEGFSQWLSWAVQDSAQRGEDVAKAWHKIRPMDIEPLLYLLQAAERRNAFPSALTYLDKAERIDAVHSVVRASRLRLLAGSALRHLEQKKPHLAADKLKAIAALPQSKQGDRPAFMAALGYVIALDRADDRAMDETRAEVVRLLGSDIAAGLLVCGISAAAKRRPVELPPVKNLSRAEQSALPARIARLVALAKDVGIKKFHLPFPYLKEAASQFPRVSGSLDIGQLRTLAETALAMDDDELAYAASGEGLSRGGETEARFLVLRARCLPERQGTRHAICAAAAAELARPHRDMETVGEAVDLVRRLLDSDPFTLTLDQAREVVRKEIAASDYPAGSTRGPDYSALLPNQLCNCPKCRRARGETPSPFNDLDFDDDYFDDEKMEKMFNERVPEGMPPELAQMLFEVLKEGYRNGLSPDEILEGLEDMGGLGGSFGSKGKKGKRK